MQTARVPRIVSIDIIRALTMVLMIFVNDLWSLKGIPAWLEHTAADTDGMGLADTVFPAFLMIVGMSIPFAVDSRERKGESPLQIFWHIMQRSFDLLIMGVFLVNGETINEIQTGMSDALWNSLSCLAFVLLWNAYPAAVSKKLITALKITGWTMLLIMAWLYRGGNSGTERFASSWWGILGLIGWAYFITATVFVGSGQKIVCMILFWLLCLAYSCGIHSGVVPFHGFIAMATSPLGHGAMPALVAAGTIISLLFIRKSKQANASVPIIILLLVTAGLIVLGFFVRRFWGISKIHASPSWVLICSGITIVAFLFIYWIADVKNKISWFYIIKPAGTNTLTCYLLPYFAYAIVAWMPVSLPDSLLTGIPGLLKSFLFSLLIVNLTGLLSRWGLRLKL